MITVAEHGRLVDLADAWHPAPSPAQILDALVEAFELPRTSLIEVLICIDFVTLRREVMQ